MPGTLSRSSWPLISPGLVNWLATAVAPARTTATPSARVPIGAAPLCKHDDAQGKQQGQARYQLPPVQADFPEGPQRTGEQHQGVDTQGGTTGSEQQAARQQQADAGQQVVQRAAQQAQFDASGQQGQAHQ